MKSKECVSSHCPFVGECDIRLTNEDEDFWRSRQAPCDKSC